MATSVFNVRMDEELKARMDETASAIGLTTAAAFNVFARQFVAHRGFPFDVVVPTPSEKEYAAEMERVYAEMKAGKASVHELVED